MGRAKGKKLEETSSDVKGWLIPSETAMSFSPLPEAPGASAARTLGILSIVFGLLCFPVGLVLAIIALVQHNKARSAFAAAPGAYAPVSGTGLVTAIVGLVMPLVLVIVGIIAAIAIPALLGQRSRARDKAAIANLVSMQADLVGEFDKALDEKIPTPAIPARLEAKLRAVGGGTRNPWSPSAGPAYVYTVAVVDAESSEAIADQAKSRVPEKGQAVFVVTLPTSNPARSGYLAGAVSIETSVNGSRVFTKVTELN
jgi:hypothetical protein